MLIGLNQAISELWSLVRRNVFLDRLDCHSVVFHTGYFGISIMHIIVSYLTP